MLDGDSAGHLTETWAPAFGHTDPQMSICSLLADRVRDHPDSIFAESKQADGTFRPITISEFDDDVLRTARGLIAVGVGQGDRVGIMGATRYQWSVVDFAILSCNAVSVPIYQTSSREQVRWIATDSDLTFLVVETTAMGELARSLLNETGLQQVIVIDEGGLEELASMGSRIPESAVRDRSSLPRSDTLATIVYTSGTTGRPKGVELTHGNFVVHAINGADDPNLGGVVTGQDKRVLLFLPLAHTFGRYIVILSLYSGSVIGYAPDTKDLVADLQAFHPTWLLAVPRVFETFYNSADTMAGAGMSQRIFRWAARMAQEYSQSLDRKGPSPWLRLRRAVANRLVFRRIAVVMGGRVEYAISGGAPLAEWLGHFFRGMGITVMEGYGMTELSAPTAVNRPGLIKIGSVGAPYPGTSVRIENEEVMVKGPNVFLGYHNDPQTTAESFRNGWFLTGDLGWIDLDGYLHITGRRKEIIITAGGENVQPAILENVLRVHPLISEVVIIGEGRPFIAALITLDATMLPGWLGNHGLRDMPIEEAAHHPRVKAALDEAVAEANAHVSRAQSIRKYAVLPREFSVEDGEMSASLKVRRPEVLRHFSSVVDSIYGGR